MEATQTHGAFSWCELITTDPKAAATFYRQLFQWKVETSQMPGGPYHLAKVEDGSAVAGIMNRPLDAPTMPPAWGCYFTVDNADETAGECQALGGRILVAPTDVPGVGRFAVLQDPQGAIFNIIAYVDD